MRTSPTVLAILLTFQTMIDSTAADVDGQISIDQSDPIELNITPYPYNTDVYGNDLPIEIGRFRVAASRGPEVRGADVELGFVRYLSDLEQSAPTIVFLAEDNTQSAGYQTLYSEMTEFGDVIVFNRRGYGLSATPPPCPDRLFYPLNKTLDQYDLANMTRNHAIQCLEFLEESGFHQSAYADTQIALDLVDLATALGVDRLLLIAEEDSTTAVIRLMEMRSDLVAAAILVNLPQNNTSIERATFQIIDHHGDRSEDTQTITLEAFLGLSESLQANPRTVEVTSPTGRNVSITVGDFDLAFVAVQSFVSDRATRTRFLSALKAATHDDFSELGRLVLATREYLIQPRSIDLIRASRHAVPMNDGDTSTFEYAAAWPGEFLATAASVDRLQDMLEIPPRRVLVVNGRLDLFSSAALSANWSQWSEIATVVEVDDAGREVLFDTPELRSLISRFIHGERIRPYTIIH